MAGAQSSRQQPRLAPITNEGTQNQIRGQYIVVFRAGTSRATVAAAQERAKALGGTIGFTYTASLIGFSVKLPEDVARAKRALQGLRASPGVSYIEADQKGSINTIQPPNPPGNPPTGIDRIDRRLLPLNNSYTYSETGVGVHAYVLDTGIRATHSEFGGRASGAFTAINDGNGTNDCNGHGTHVAGTIGGATFGVAKGVTIHAVRVADCGGSVSIANAVAGVDFVTANAIHPAVANMSLQFVPVSAALDTAITNSIASGVTYAVAGGNFSVDACTVSPAATPNAITVGATDPATDTRAGFSDFGTCIKLFAPGVNILSAWNTNDTATNTISGTSMATPHVAGAVARHLQNAPLDSPAAVLNWINLVADVNPGTPGWPGVLNLGVGSPNELLHIGSLNNGHDDGDPHFTTVDGVHYDFQGAGEFVALRDGNVVQIQTRQTGVTTAPPAADPHTALTSCVSINTAIAARVGTHRVTYQPAANSATSASALQLRVDGVPATLGPAGITLGPGGRVVQSGAANGIEIDFPDGTTLSAVPNFWPSQNKTYLTISVFGTQANEGIMGEIASGSWLPAFPNGTSLGPQPASAHQRYVDLYQKFANAWRVTNATSLFDYAPGTSTAQFTFAGWPPENPPCVFKDSPPAKPIDQGTAQKLCSEVADKNRNANCVFDVAITGEPGFVKTYLISQRIEAGATRTVVNDDKDPTLYGAPVTFTAMVARVASNRGTPAGSVQFTLAGSKVGAPLKVGADGRAVWKTSQLSTGKNLIAARFVPAEGSVYLPSTSLDKVHTVIRREATKY